MPEKHTCGWKMQKYGVVEVVVARKINGVCSGDLKPQNSTNQKKNRGEKRKINRKEVVEHIPSPTIDVEEDVVVGCGT